MCLYVEFAFPFLWCQRSAFSNFPSLVAWCISTRALLNYNYICLKFKIKLTTTDSCPSDAISFLFPKFPYYTITGSTRNMLYRIAFCITGCESTFLYSLGTVLEGRPQLSPALVSICLALSCVVKFSLWILFFYVQCSALQFCWDTLKIHILEVLFGNGWIFPRLLMSDPWNLTRKFFWHILEHSFDMCFSFYLGCDQITPV